MFDLIISCCGTVKSVDIFQQARVACTQPNWQAPPPEPLQRILQVLEGKIPENDSQVSFSNLLAHLQQDDLRKNVTFALKNLIILDFIVEERMFLSRISRYYNSQLIYMQGGQLMTNKLLSTIKDLIASYYVYIKQKSKYYQLQSRQLLQQKKRQQFMQKSNSITILNQVNVCFKIQNLILDINLKYKNGDKLSELVQFIYSLLLRTYLFCHSIVKIALKTFVKRIPQLSKYDLEYIKKFANYFKQEYLKNLAFFLSSNQNIPAFRDIQYEQMIKVDQNLLSLIETQLNFIYEDPGICPEPQEINEQKIKVMADQKQKEKKQKQKLKEKQNQKNQSANTYDTNQAKQETLVKRKEFSLQQAPQSQAFTNYINLYLQSFPYENQIQTDTNSFMDPAQIFTYYGCPMPEQQEQQQEQDQQIVEQEQNKIQAQSEPQVTKFQQAEQQISAQ